jgi:acyl-CoA synthetase (AMP-forming)/AMP-acid ligase II
MDTVGVLNIMAQDPSPQFFTIPDFIFKGGQRDEGIAIEGVNGRTITYRGLRENVQMVVGWLNSLGFRRKDRIAIALPDGFEMAISLVAIPSGFTAIPLNPSFSVSEFNSYMLDIGAKALVTDQNEGTPLRGVAKDQGIEVIELILPKSKGEVAFTIAGHSGNPAGEPEFAGTEDVAFVMQTSGTTSKPKWVPLTQSNVCYNVFNRSKYLAASVEDRGLIIVPLFHAQGLMSLYGSLYSGGIAVCPPSFNPLEFYRLLDSVRPTWYVGGSTIHQSVLDTAKGNEDIISRSRLKRIRTGAGSTPQRTMQELERLFGAHFIETYATTEGGATAWNPDPSHSNCFILCYPFGPEVTIIGDDAQILPQGKHGEIMVRGPSVFGGYENDPTANFAAFIDGWFRTGDRGYLDEVNHLHLDGRVKEVINRGGEKVAPQDVEEALLEHQAVAEAVVFPVPHPTLGEDVVAAIVLRRGQEVGEKDLRAFLFDRLVYFKVPTRIVFVESIPKGPAGKVSRLDMARTLGFLQEVR